VYHYAANNPVRYVDPDGKNPRSALTLIAKHSEQIKEIANFLKVDPVGIASIIFQEKYHGVFANVKNVLAYISDGGVNDDTPSTRSYGLAEMQLGLAAELLGKDINAPGTKAEIFKILQDDNASIALIGLNIKKNEHELGIKLRGSAAGGAHNMGVSGYKAFLEGQRELSSVGERSIEYQQAINDALNGIINPLKDSDR
jgi:hypothetical protein